MSNNPRRRVVTRIGGVAAGPLMLAVGLAGVAAPAAAQAHDGHMHPVTLRLDPSVGSKAKGTATLTPTEDGGLKVVVSATGMIPDMPHAQHIHGDVSGHRFTCPTSADDKDKNGFLTVEEGLPNYGKIHISLTTTGDTSPNSGLAVDRMPKADSGGNLSYSRTLTKAELPEGTLMALHNLHMVQHGVDANGNNKYDVEGSGESTFAKSMGAPGIPSEATDVATCGMVMPVGGHATGGEPVSSPRNGLMASGAGLIVLAGATGVVARRRSRKAQH